ncbi:MAG: hypothetical protein SPK72_03540 [Bacteroidales bacterium]|jgi:hypothetical protein|nr:hypothetical protein [Bacteroidales bacterium]
MGFFMFHKRSMPEFKYIPRYYDPEKEEMERRKAALGLDSNLTDSERLRVQMRQRWGRTGEDGRPKKRANSMRTMRMAIIVGFSLFFVYLLFFTPFVENFITMFLKLGGK